MKNIKTGMDVWKFDPSGLCAEGKRLLGIVVERAGSENVEKVTHGFNIHQRDANCPWLASLIEHAAKCKKCSRGLIMDSFRASNIVRRGNP